MRGRLAAAFGAAIALALTATEASACGGGSKTAALVVYEAKAAKGGPGAPSYTPEEGDTDGYTQVYVADAKKGTTRRVTDGAYNSGNPAWSPDRSRIIFKSDRDNQPGRDDLYTMKADGSDVRRLTETPDIREWTPKYSPDGKTIVYVRVVPREGTFLALMDADGGNQRQVAGPYAFAEFPAWKKDGSQVYFSAIERGRNDADIYAYDIASGAVMPVVSSPAADVCPHFTHDGKTLTYASVAPGGDGDNVDLFAHDMTGGGAPGPDVDRRLTDDPAVDDYGNPSPDDREIVYIHKSGASADLWLMSRDGSNKRPLVVTPDLDENVPDW